MSSPRRMGANNRQEVGMDKLIHTENLEYARKLLHKKHHYLRAEFYHVEKHGYKPAKYLPFAWDIVIFR